MPKLTDKDLLSNPATGDFIHVVDVSDTSADAAGTSKRVTIQSIVDLLGTLSGATWGAISGTLSDQTDLQAALDGKAAALGANDNYVTDAEKTVIGNTSGTNTGDQDLSALATKANVLELDNTTAFTPDADYEPATKKYVDDNAGGATNLSVANRTSTTLDVASDTGTNATVPEATDTQAGLLAATDKVKLLATTGTNTGDQDISGIATNAGAIADHIADTVDAHDASAISTVNTNFKVITATDQQTYNEQNDTALLNARTTGIRFGGVPTVSGGLGTGTGLDITAGAGQILDNTDPSDPTYTAITWTAQSNVTQTTTPGVTWWYFDDNSNAVKQTATAPTSATSRTRIYVARTSYTGSAITGLVTSGNPVQQEGQSLKDLAEALGTFKVSGLMPDISGANLKVKVTSGVLFSYHSNWDNSFLDPHKPTEATFDTGVSDTFRYGIPSGTITVNQTDLQVANYAPAGVVTAIPGATSRVGVHYVWRFPGGNTRLSYSADFYANVTAAKEELSESLAAANAPSTYGQNALLLGAILAEKGETDLNNATFVSTNSFGSFSGGVSQAAGGSYLEIANNLSDLLDAATARTNLGLGTAATTASTDYATAAQGTTADSALQPNTAISVDEVTYDSPKAAVSAIGNSGSSQTLNALTSTIFTTSLTANCAFTFSNLTAGKSIELHMYGDGTQRTPTFPTAKLLYNDTTIAYPTTTGELLVLTARHNGTEVVISAAGTYAAFA